MYSRRILKACALLLVVSLLTVSNSIPGGGVPIGLAQGPVEDMVFLGDEVDGLSDSVEGVELPEKRTLTSKTYQVGPDEYRAVISVAPMHYVDEEGSWQDIDTTVEPQADGSYYAGANLVKARFPGQLGAGGIEIRIPGPERGMPNSSRVEPSPPTDLTAAAGSRDVSVSWHPAKLAYSTGVAPAPQRVSSADVTRVSARVDGNSVVYESAFPGVSEEFRVMPGGVKHSLILSSLPDFVPENPPPDTFLDYQVEMRLSPGISLYTDGVEQQDDFFTSSPIELRRGEDETVGYLLAPYAYERDNPREAIPGFHAVHFEPDRIIITVRTPLSWLAAPDRVFPVVIDPTTDAYQWQDTFISDGYPNQAHAVWSDMYTGYDSISGYGNERVLIAWDVESVPASSVINTAAISLYQSHWQGNAWCTLGFYKMLTLWGSAYATWNQRIYGVPWNSPGASGAGTDYDVAGLAFAFPEDPGWLWTGHHAEFGNWVAGWVADPFSNFGVILEPPGNPASYDCARGFRTQNYNVGEFSPTLEVDYTFTGGTPTLLEHNFAQTHTYPDPEDYFREDSVGYTGYWRGTALRPLYESDYDLWLHTASDFSSPQTNSRYGIGRVDYTLTRKSVTTTGYPRVVWFDGTDNYNIGYMRALEQIAPPYLDDWYFGANALWGVFELELNVAGSWQVILTPLSGNPDLGVAIHDPAIGDYQSRADAVAISDQVGQNLTEQIEFTASSSGNFGLIVWSNVRTGVTQGFLLEVKAPGEKTYLPFVLKNYVSPKGPFSNGGFENNSRWILAGELEHTRTTAKHRSGSYSLRLGHDGEDPCYNGVPCSGSGDDCQSVATATQGFDVPNNARSLKFYYQIYTYDHRPEGDRAADYFAAYIRDLSTSEKTLVYRDDLSWVNNYKCYNLSKKSAWQTVSGIDLSPYRGKTVELIFEVTNGGHNFWNTWVFIDDVTCNGC